LHITNPVASNGTTTSNETTIPDDQLSDTNNINPVPSSFKKAEGEVVDGIAKGHGDNSVYIT
jgi:hypothetical protein